MSALTLSNSYSPIFQDDTDRLMRILGMRREPLADYTKSLGYVREHNGGGGRHLLDFSKRGHHSLRRAYGASLGWILGDFSTSNASETIASNAGNALRAFFACDPNSGVIVLERHQDEFGVFLHEKTICGNPRMLLDEDCSLLLPTGVTSPRIGDEMLYERLDLARCYDRSAAFSVREVLFTGADGESIAGLGDVSGMFVENLPELLPSLYNILGDNYDLASINALIYSAIRRHSDYAPYDSEIEVPLLESDDTDQNVTMLLRRTQRSSWRVVFLLGADTYTLEEVAPRRKLSVQESEVMAARSRLFSAFRSLPNFNGKIDFGSVFSAEHLNRLPSDFRKEVEDTPEAAQAKFLIKMNESLERFKKDERHWLLIYFSAGRERNLSLNGESTEMAIQLCAPLYLTTADERIKRASVYAVAEVREDAETGKLHCNVPSILDSRMAIGDANNLKRCLQRGRSAA